MIATNINLSFRLSGTTLPTVEEQYQQMWQLACSLRKASIGLEEWHPPAGTPEASLLNAAFNDAGPTKAALALATAEDQEYPNMRAVGVWNGKETNGAVAFSSTLVVSGGASNVSLQSADVLGLGDAKIVAEILQDALSIWPAAFIEVGPFKYYSRHQVFKDRPGAGWMLYLPRVLTVRDVPEAQALVPIIENGKRKGTVVVSVTGEAFDVDNAEHTRRANAIEVRLVDQDMLPKYADV